MNLPEPRGFKLLIEKPKPLPNSISESVLNNIVKKEV